MKTGLIIYEDNIELRDSIERLVSGNEDLLLLGSFPNALHAEEQVKRLEPEIILMDIDMPGITGIEAVKKIRKTNHKVHIIMLTVFEQSDIVLNAICAGASGYLLKKHLLEKLENSIREALTGGAPMSPGIARLVIQHMQQQKPAANNYNLTPREKEILLYLSKGNSYKLIASMLSISIDTVRTHIKRIYEKLQVHSQTEAVFKATNEGLV